MRKSSPESKGTLERNRNFDRTHLVQDQNDDQVHGGGGGGANDGGAFVQIRFLPCFQRCVNCHAIDYDPHDEGDGQSDLLRFEQKMNE